MGKRNSRWGIRTRGRFSKLWQRWSMLKIVFWMLLLASSFTSFLRILLYSKWQTVLKCLDSIFVWISAEAFLVRYDESFTQSRRKNNRNDEPRFGLAASDERRFCKKLQRKSAFSAKGLSIKKLMEIMLCVCLFIDGRNVSKHSKTRTWIEFYSIWKEIHAPPRRCRCLGNSRNSSTSSKSNNSIGSHLSSVKILASSYESSAVNFYRIARFS